MLMKNIKNLNITVFMISHNQENRDYADLELNLSDRKFPANFMKENEDVFFFRHEKSFR